MAHALTRRAKRSISATSKSPGFRNFPHTLLEAFLIAFRYGNGMVLKRIFLCSVDSASPDEVLTQNRADRPRAIMKLRHLEYFVAAAEELNFTHAADRLHVSQPPFSKQIQDLEGELGVNLFQRERKTGCAGPPEWQRGSKWGCATRSSNLKHPKRTAIREALNAFRQIWQAAVEAGRKGEAGKTAEPRAKVEALSREAERLENESSLLEKQLTETRATLNRGAGRRNYSAGYLAVFRSRLLQLGGSILLMS